MATHANFGCKIGYLVTGTLNIDKGTGFNNLFPNVPTLSAIGLTGKTIFERLYWVLGLHQIAP